VIDGLINLQQKVQSETLQDHVKGPAPITPAARL
jgi:NADH-quinone oxidoreductase subunit B